MPLGAILVKLDLIEPSKQARSGELFWVYLTEGCRYQTSFLVITDPNPSRGSLDLEGNRTGTESLCTLVSCDLILLNHPSSMSYELSRSLMCTSLSCRKQSCTCSTLHASLSAAISSLRPLIFTQRKTSKKTPTQVASDQDTNCCYTRTSIAFPLAVHAIAS